jgi:hypothetical protein
MKKIPLNLRLHSFGRHGHGHSMPERNDRLDDGGGFAALPQALGE